MNILAFCLISALFAVSFGQTCARFDPIGQREACRAQRRIIRDNLRQSADLDLQRAPIAAQREAEQQRVAEGGFRRHRGEHARRVAVLDTQLAQLDATRTVRRLFVFC
jgi:hypothetical protein